MAWAYFCWRDGGGLVIASFPLTFGVADFCGCRIFGGLPVAGQNDRGGVMAAFWPALCKARANVECLRKELKALVLCCVSSK
ncbi:hypothetical protein NDU88_003781 [Pleurodeles waltl]|uniref:Secreted protein n=1 Tax=Pleurodeles waltl TaxID=8319 RepID=A0AAV7W7Y0_PLEWA|nr:hypothetical protein NDU88_003781 [Pleurodeles waltl]